MKLSFVDTPSSLIHPSNAQGAALLVAQQTLPRASQAPRQAVLSPHDKPLYALITLVAPPGPSPHYPGYYDRHLPFTYTPNGIFWME